MPYDPDQHNRRSIDCVCLFGEVIAGRMRLNPFGRVVAEEWRPPTKRLRDNVTLDSQLTRP